METAKRVLTTDQTFAGTVRRGEGAEHVGAILFEIGDHDLTALTAVVAGRREVVGLEILPALGETPKERRDGWTLRMARYLESLPPGWGRAPIESDWLRRGVSVREILRIYAAQEAKLSVLPEDWKVSRISDHHGPVGISEEELGKLDSLVDAALYVAALAVGRSPVAAIAEHRSISPRTAEGRVGRARRLGLLTPAVGRRAGGELTPEAADLLGRVSTIWPQERGENDG